MQTPDTKPGFYYVSVFDGPRSARLLGPFVNDHAQAIASVDAARARLEIIDPKAHFYAFGTCRTDKDLGPGFLDTLVGVRS